MLIEPIKRDSPTQLGLAFALFYVTFAIPVARLADLKSRRNLIAVCMIVWSSIYRSPVWGWWMLRDCSAPMCTKATRLGSSGSIRTLRG